MGNSFRSDAQECLADVSMRKYELSQISGYDSQSVRGSSDTTSVSGASSLLDQGFVESIDHLDIYADFLGEQEYAKMKENYHRAL